MSGNIEGIISKWMTAREKAIWKLEELADELEELQKDVNIAKLVGTGTSLACGIGSVVAGVATFFTAGLAAPAAVGLGILSGAGGVTTIVSSIIEKVKESDKLKAAKRALKEDAELSKQLHDFVRLTKEEELDKLPPAVYLAVVSVAQILSVSASVGSRIGLQVAANAGRGALSALGKVTKVASPVLGVLIIPLDIYELVVTGMEVHDNNPNKIAQELRKYAKNLKDGIDKVKNKMKSPFPH